MTHDDTFERAARQLSDYVEQTALGLLGPSGSCVVAVPDAPSTFDGIVAEYHAMLAGSAFRVSNAGGPCIYLTEKHNHYFRLWHDCCHATMQLDLTRESEYLVGLHHVYMVGEAFGHAGPAAKLMRIDTLGQLDYYHRHGEFVHDQRSFALSLF